MALQQEYLPVVCTHGLEQAIAIEVTVVKRGNARLSSWYERAVKVDDFLHHFTSTALVRGFGKRRKFARILWPFSVRMDSGWN